MVVSYDPKSKTFKPVDEKKSTTPTGQKLYSPRIKIQEPLLGTILGFARQDKLPLTRKGKNGKPIDDRGRITKAVSLYVIEAVKEFCEARAHAGQQ